MTDHDSTKTLEPGTLLGGKLRVIRLLGEGGMGAVYEVQHEITKHRRALKLLHADVRKRHPQIVQRFLREASVAGTLGDPHIVETFDAGELPSGEPYLVMELLDGESLASRIARGRLAISEVVAIAVQVCAAMEVAHKSGIVHRDLKPENLFLCRKPAGFVKVLDFGISKFDSALSGVEGAARTQEGLALGTPYYMPPEQVRGARDIDARADVYAIGIILYEALSGRRPFDADSMPHLMVLIHEGKAHPLRTLRADVSVELAALVARAMASDRDQRTQTVTALRAELEAIVLVESERNPALDATALGMGEPAAPHRIQVVSHPEGPSDPLAHTDLATAKSMAAIDVTPPRRSSSGRWLVATGLIVAVGLGGWVLLGRDGPTPSTQGAASTEKSTIDAPSSAAPPAVSASTPGVASTAAPIGSPSVPATVTVPSSSAIVAKPPASTTTTTTGASTTTKPTASSTGTPKPLPSGLAGNPF